MAATVSGKNILKSRDDISPLFFERCEESRLKLCPGISSSWVKPGHEVDTQYLRKRIEPWLTALFQAEHLSLLVGSGLTHAVHRIAKGKALPGMDQYDFAVFKDQIGERATLSAEKTGRGKSPNLEDQIRVVNEMIAGLDHYCSESSKFEGKSQLKEEVAQLKHGLSSVLEKFAESILEGERSIATAPEEKRILAFDYLVNFLMGFASRSGTRDRLHIFSTNYDRLIEAGADVAGLRLLDRFVGSLTPIFRSCRLDTDMHYNPPGIRGEPRFLEGVSRITKLHGSLDWICTGPVIRKIGLPFGAESISPYLKAPGLGNGEASALMIYPNSTKDRETAAYPYVDLFRDFAAANCRPNNVLVTYGYSFGDEHINRVVEDMLTIPSTHLVVISFDDPLGRIMDFYERNGRPVQTTLLIGDHFGDLKTLVGHYLPKPAIDKTTFRMSELLKSRYGVDQEEVSNQGIQEESVDDVF